MSEPEMTWLLAAVNLVICAVAHYVSRRPAVTAFRLWLISTLLVFSVTPSIDRYYDMTSLMDSHFTWDDFNRGLSLQLIYTVSFIIGYFCLWRRPSRTAKPVRPAFDTGIVVMAVAVGLASLGVIHVLSGGEWISPSRTMIITALLPMGQIWFRICAAALCLSVMAAIVLMIESPRTRRLLVPLVLVASVADSLLHQRGFLIYVAIFALWYMEKTRGLRARSVLAAVLVSTLALTSMRPFVQLVSEALAGESGLAAPEADDSPMPAVWTQVQNFHMSDAWPVTFQYVEDMGYERGGTLAAIPLLFLPVDIREQWGLQVAGIKINKYISQRDEVVGFANFAIVPSQELYMNLGVCGLPFGFLVGLVTAMLDNWILRVRRLTLVTVAVVWSVLMTTGFATGPGVPLTIGTAFIIVAYVLQSARRTIARSHVERGADRGVAVHAA